ncbi:hypothetical protein EF903_24995 [Streptomyces sp. WAC05292]|nr:hypothetical protein EF903_24995 [Streptomyces sp. WAC05292]
MRSRPAADPTGPGPPASCRNRRTRPHPAGPRPAHGAAKGPRGGAIGPEGRAFAPDRPDRLTRPGRTGWGGRHR